MNVGIAIDVCGTGYTSIGQLRHMPVDTIPRRPVPCSALLGAVAAASAR